MTFAEKRRKQHEEDLRRDGLIGSGETVFDYAVCVEKDASEKYLCADNECEILSEDKALLRTKHVLEREGGEPGVRSASVDTLLLRKIRAAEVRQDG